MCAAESPLFVSVGETRWLWQSKDTELRLSWTSFPRRRYPHRCHPRCGRCVEAHLRIFEHQATPGRHSESLGRDQKRLRIRLALRVIAGADQHRKSFEKSNRAQRGFHRISSTARDHRERNASTLQFHVLQNLGNALKLWEKFKIQLFFSLGHPRDRHLDTLFAPNQLDDLNDGHAAKLVKPFFRELAAPFPERLTPGNVMQG